MSEKMKKGIKKKIKIILNAFLLLRLKMHREQVFKADVDSAKELIKQVYSKKNYYGEKTSIEFTRKESSYAYDLSLIIPVYNSEKFLARCLDSLLNQKTQYRYELICVDDGSSDSSSIILQSYGEKDNVKILHKKNGGISSARNAGLDVAQGRYVGFIDNDDMVTEDYVESLLSNAYKYGADYVKSGYKLADNETGEIWEEISNEFEIVRGAMGEKILKYDGYVWGGIQKKELWDEFCFPFGYWYEDMITRLILYRRASVFVNINNMLYIKNEHKNNASKKVWKQGDTQCLDQLFLVRELIAVSSQLGMESDIALYRGVLQEFGAMLFQRTKGIDEKIRHAAFVVAADTIKGLRQPEYNISKKKIYDYYVEKSFLNMDFKMWKLISQYGSWM